MAKRYAVVDGNGDVVNAVMIADDTGWQPPAGTTLIEHEAAGPGWQYVDEQFIAPPPAETNEGME